MGGGLFGTPLYLNPKCLIFSAIILIIYWLPHPNTIAHNIVMGFLLATSAYISLAWYDYLFDCNDILKPTLFSWLSKPFKPKEYQDAYQRLPLKYQKIIHSFDIFVLVIILITFMYPFIYTYLRSAMGRK